MSDTWEYNGENWFEISHADSPSARSQHAAVYDSLRRRILLFGGWTASETNDDTWIYRYESDCPDEECDSGSDMDEDGLTDCADPDCDGLPCDVGICREGECVVTCGDGVLSEDDEECDDGNLASHDGCSSGCTEEWPTWIELEPETVPPPRHGHAMAFDASRGVIVMYGGAGPDGMIGDTWEFDGVDWTDADPTSSPAEVYGNSGLVYDSERERIVLFGGHTGSTVEADTYEYDGTEWVEVDVSSFSSPRYTHGTVYDIARDRIVAFGGRETIGAPTLRGYLQDTWEFDGDGWDEVGTETVPGARGSTAAAYDWWRNLTVLFGGYRYDGADRNLGDTWVFDGEDWSSLTLDDSPAGRSSFAMAFHGAIGRTVLFGGQNTTPGLADTWEFAGDSWDETTPVSSPTRKIYPAMAYDPTRRQIVMFGGSVGSAASATDETWIYRYVSDWPDEDCGSGADDDDDGLVDCEDPDCALLPLCTGGVCGDGFCSPVEDMDSCPADCTPDLTDGLVAYYPFDGDTDDETGHGHHGTPHGVTLTEDRDGIANSAYAFDGNDYIEIPYDIELAPANFTVAAWILTTSPTRGRIVSNNSPEFPNCHHGFDVRVEETGLGRLNIDPSAGCGGDPVFIDSDDIVSDGIWHHITAVYNGSLQLYIDGILQIDTVRSGYVPTDASVAIGVHNGYHGLDYYFVGSIDDIRIYDRPLEESEIIALSRL